MHIVFAGGGTAGYWFPGLTVAHHLRETARSRVTFLGTGSDFEGRNATIAGSSTFRSGRTPSVAAWLAHGEA
jgi:UDP-N-acetylglucosamine:LPS N-acetylglucosamine transferase